MRILSRYIFREIVSSAFLGAFLATAIIFLQRAGTLFEVVVRSSAQWESAIDLFLLALPSVLPLTIPFGVLIGILIGLGRLSTDGEITAMRAAGVPSRTVIYPVMAFAVLSTLMAGYASVRLAPWALRQSFLLVNRLLATRATVDVTPRVFDEEFTANTILYVGDVTAGGKWRNVFMADVTPPDQRKSGLREKADGPLVTLIREGLAVPDAALNRVTLHTWDSWTHEMGKDFVENNTFAPTGRQALDVQPPSEQHGHPEREMGLTELRQRAANHALPDWLQAKIELNHRFALPVACIMLAMVGVPLGVASRKGSKSSGYVTGVFLAFFCYWLAYISLTRLAAQRALPVEVALWLPNAVFGLTGLVFVSRLERPGDRDIIGMFTRAFGAIGARIRSITRTAPKQEKVGLYYRLPLLPQLIDTYVLSSFFLYFVLWLASFVAMAQVYNFFELLGDVVEHHIPLSKVFTYLFFLIPKLIYDTAPISVLVAVLVTFGIMTKNNEVTAFKACGVSLYRLAVPVLFFSLLFSGALFAFDFWYVPDANLRQDALRNEIKGKAPQTYLRPDRKWIVGNVSEGSRIYYYQYFDKDENVMGKVSVYELDPKTFNLVRWISADRAQWQPGIHNWIFQNGWVKDYHGVGKYDFNHFQATTFGELNETPSWFLKEVVLDTQMNFIDLDRYILELQRSGFETVKLKVRFYRKFSVPLFALIMAMLAVPFSFLVGNRGAMAGIGMSLGVMIAYEGIGTLFEKLGDVGYLPPAVAAWSPDVLFGLVGLYLLLRMRS